MKHELIFILLSLINIVNAFTCTVPDLTGYSTSGNYADSTSFTVVATCAVGYSGSGNAEACEADGVYILSGCTVCINGKYQDQNTLTTAVCKTCVAGQYTTAKDVACKACETGKFQELTAAVAYTCKNCAAGFAFATLSTACTECINGRYQLSSSTAAVTCLDCAVGQYTTAKDVACKACETGKFQELAAADAYTCKNCAAGFAFATKSTVCTECINGRYQLQSSTAAVTCLGCAAGQYTTAKDVACKACETGKFQELAAAVEYTCKNCAAGFAFATKSTACTECINGRYQLSSSGAAVTCNTCSAGQYTTAKDIVCKTCETGKFQETTAIEYTCKFCAVGKEFTTKSDACKVCETGKFQDKNDVASVGCKFCDVGTKFIATTAACADCVGGKYQEQSALATAVCKTCDIGQYAVDSTVVCKNCPIGMYQETSPATVYSCKTCLLGEVQPLPGQGSCSDCVVGKYDDGDEVCSDCVTGQYQSDVGKSSCDNCEVGKVQPLPGQGSCSDCVVGKYDDGDEECSICISGQYQSDVGKSSCDNCAVGLYSLNLGASSNTTCKVCVVGRFSGSVGSSICNICGTGKYMDEPAATACKNCAVDTALFDGYGNEYGSSALNHDNADDCETCQSSTSAPLGSSLCTCLHSDGTNRNSIDCRCKDSSSESTCTSNRYCYIGIAPADWPTTTRCGATGGEIIVNGVFRQRCPNTNGIEQVLGSDKCVCGSGTTVCNRYQYCNDIGAVSAPIFQCQNMADCRKNDGLFENTGDCFCRRRESTTTPNYITCDSTTGLVCNSGSGGPTCNKAICINNVASIANTVECRCMQTRDSTERSTTCTVGKYCFDPVSVQCNAGGQYSSIFPPCGCSDDKIESCMSEQGEIDGTTPNLLSLYCSCTSEVYGTNSLCLKEQYCNREFGVCADEPAPSCKHKDGKTVNLEPCLCGTEQCGVGGFMCSPTATSKCHKQLCSDYEALNPNWCNIEGKEYGNGVKLDEACAGYICSDIDTDTCCKPCSGASVWDGKCRKLCPDPEHTTTSKREDSFCFDEWVDPPSYYEYVTNIQQNSEDISYAWFKQNSNPFYAGHCDGPVCDNVISNISNSTTDSKYCCLPSNNCKDDTSGALCQGSEYTKEIKDKRCDRFLCTADECCYKTECQCNNGEGSTGRDCPTPGDGGYSCASCNTGYWLNGVECILARDCLDNQYQFRQPTGFSDRICYYKSVCNDAQYESTPATSTYDRGCSGLTTCTSTEYIERTSNITTGFKTSDIKCAALPTCTDVQYMVKTVNTAEGVTMTNYSCDIVTVCGPLEFETVIPTSETDRVCNTTTLCQDSQYERTRPSLTTDRICVAPTVCNTTNEYETLGPTNITNRICNTIKDCDLTEFEAIGPTNISDRVCNSSTTCQSSEYETSPLTNYTDRTCQVAKVCDVDILEYESIPMTTTTDRSCKTCTDDDCVGCMTTTDCEYNTKSKIHNQSECSSLTCTRFIIPDGTFSGILHYGEWFRFESNSTTPFVISAPNIIQKVNYSYFYIETDFNGTITFQGTALRIQQDCTFEEPTWGACSNMCGAGHELGIRGTKIKDASHGGKTCSETPKITYRDCNGTFCPIDCNITWDDSYLPCNAACGVQGIQYKNYTIHNPAKYGGVECPALKRRGCVGLNKPPYCDCLKRKMDACGICGGDSSTCTGCDGVVDRNEETRKVYNECGICARKGTPCTLKHSQTRKDRKKFRSNILKILLPVGTALLLFAASFGVVFFLTRPKTIIRKKREIYLS